MQRNLASLQVMFRDFKEVKTPKLREFSIIVGSTEMGRGQLMRQKKVNGR